MFIVNNKQMAEADAACSSQGYELMERAGKAVFDFVSSEYKGCKILVMCGSGNNGGDGFVIARLLINSNFKTHIALPNAFESSGKEAMIALQNLGEVDFLKWHECNFGEYDLIIDAIFGTGISKDVNDETGCLFEKINKSKCCVVSVDIPSGIDGSNGKVRGYAIKADHTLTFAALKIGHVLHPGKYFSGYVKVVNIGIQITDYTALLNKPELWGYSLNYPQASMNKYDRGYVAVFGGNTFMSGAAKLVAYGSLRTFAGIAAIICNEENKLLYSQGALSVLLKDVNEIFCDRKVGAFVVGPGSSLCKKTRINTIKCIESGNCVIDADAISVFKDAPRELFEKIKKSGFNVILTPHTGEFVRLFDLNRADKIESVKKAAAISGAVVILKGDDTVIASPDGRIVINGTGAPQLATAGSGDVLSGIVGAILSSGVDAFDSACAGVWIHGKAASEYGIGLISEDIPLAASKVVAKLFALFSNK